jgi:hypothetical protein
MICSSDRSSAGLPAACSVICFMVAAGIRITSIRTLIHTIIRTDTRTGRITDVGKIKTSAEMFRRSFFISL